MVAQEASSEGLADDADDVGHLLPLTGRTSLSLRRLWAFLQGRLLQSNSPPDHSEDEAGWEVPVRIPLPVSPAWWEALHEEDKDLLSQIITVESLLTASNTDFLAGTQLDQPGVPGVYTIWGASTVGDTTITVSLGGRLSTDQAVLTLRANSEIRENEDTFFQVLSVTAGRPVINITEVTAATIRIRVKFIPAFPT